MVPYLQNIFQGTSSAWSVFLFLVVAIWSLLWKGLGLWKAARWKQKKWFIALLILNTLGVFEIIYISFFQKKKKSKKKKTS